MDQLRRIATSELAVPETQAPALEQVNSDLNDIGRGMQEAITRLWHLHNRLFGPMPISDIKGCGESKPSGLIGEINGSVITLRGLTSELNTLASELERVA